VPPRLADLEKLETNEECRWGQSQGWLIEWSPPTHISSTVFHLILFYIHPAFYLSHLLTTVNHRKYKYIILSSVVYIHWIWFRVWLRIPRGTSNLEIEWLGSSTVETWCLRDSSSQPGCEWLVLNSHNGRVLLVCLTIFVGKSQIFQLDQLGVSSNGGTPKSSIFWEDFPFINQPFWGFPIYGAPHFLPWLWILIQRPLVDCVVVDCGADLAKGRWDMNQILALGWHDILPKLEKVCVFVSNWYSWNVLDVFFLMNSCCSTKTESWNNTLQQEMQTKILWVALTVHT